MMPSKPYSRGFTLVEVLVAVFVLAIGLLGLAGLQAKSLQFNYSAYQRSQATILAYDIIDRMRANLGEAQAGNYDITDTAGPPSSTNCQTNSATCGASTMASFDLSQWKCALGTYDANTACTTFGIKGALLEGVGSVVTNAGVVTVTVKWADDRTKESTDNARKTSFTVSTAL
ncbi:type IV pilus modification protein PilV [Sulfuriflexus sp.]|uniref:type IV pilus modification protein PilV n=1 Tax=Sulfuriflexus sp. TaxID=2015443 RepID=UPI0028CDF404|nr:type IV pilus modification protein PilV [Sulfuriflexus sp.]MDT8403751.1 type IV pilus modification protein PilV [Sulfuriflexus sp.]